MIGAAKINKKAEKKSEKVKEACLVFFFFFSLSPFHLFTKKVIGRTHSLTRPDSRLYIIPFPRSARDKNPNLTLNTDE